MYKGKKFLAIIPARSGSKGLPNKNIKKLLGTHLIGWPIKAALKSKYLDNVIVSTDCIKIARIAESYGAEIPFLRPKELATDTASSISVIIDLLNQIGLDKYDYITLLEPTSPTTDSNDIDDSIESIIDNESIADSIVGISKLESTHPSFCVSLEDDGTIKQFGGNFDGYKRRQDLKSLYFRDGSIYISKIDSLIKNKTFYHSRTLGKLFPKWKSYEIDDIVDFLCIENILKNIKIIDLNNEK